MKKGLNFIGEVLKELNSTLSENKEGSFISTDKSEKLRFSFFNGNGWHGFELTEEDLNKDPKNIVQEIKEDLNL